MDPTTMRNESQEIIDWFENSDTVGMKSFLISAQVDFTIPYNFAVEFAIKTEKVIMRLSKISEYLLLDTTCILHPFQVETELIPTYMPKETSAEYAFDDLPTALGAIITVFECTADTDIIRILFL